MIRILMATFEMTVPVQPSNYKRRVINQQQRLFLEAAASAGATALTQKYR